MTSSLAAAAADRAHRRGGGVRVVAKIFPTPSAASGGNFRASVSRSGNGEGAAITFACVSEDVAGSRKKDSVCRFDGCYGTDAGVDVLYVSEVQPLVRGVATGRNACVIAFGAQGAGKTRLLQGVGEGPGLMHVAVEEILNIADEGKASVCISAYEFHQDRIFDLLNQNGKEVLLLEDAEHRIVLKNLSKVPIRSPLEFEKKYLHAVDEKKMKKCPDDVMVRNHSGLIIYFSFHDDSGKGHIEAKINFVNLAGYEDTKSNTCSRSSLSANRSLHSLMNVVCALNGDDTYVNYRESKLARILQEFWCDNGSGVVINCMNDVSSQDTIHAVNLASRSSQIVNRNSRISSCGKSVSRWRTPTSTQQLAASVKKHDSSLLASAAKRSVPNLALEKRQLKFGSATKTSVKKGSTNLSSRCDMKPAPLAIASKEIIQNNLQLSEITNCEESSSSLYEEALKVEEVCVVKEIIVDDSSASGVHLDNFVQSLDNGNGQISNVSSDLFETPTSARQSSSKISEQLKEISNNLKHWSSKPINFPLPQVHNLDSHTPRLEQYQNGMANDNRFAGTPGDKLKARSAGLKRTLVKEFMAFLNSATKEQLTEIKGIGERRATHILNLREEKPEPFQDIENLRDIGLSSNQAETMMLELMRNV